jgi:hypothetical protein
VKAYQQYEDDLLRAGQEPQAEADYAAFYATHGTARPAPTRFALSTNNATKFVRRYAWVIVGFAALISALAARGWFRARRATGTAAPSPGA